MIEFDRVEVGGPFNWVWSQSSCCLFVLCCFVSVAFTTPWLPHSPLWCAFTLLSVYSLEFCDSHPWNFSVRGFVAKRLTPRLAKCTLESEKYFCVIWRLFFQFFETRCGQIWSALSSSFLRFFQVWPNQLGLDVPRWRVACTAHERKRLRSTLHREGKFLRNSCVKHAFDAFEKRLPLWLLILLKFCQLGNCFFVKRMEGKDNTHTRRKVNKDEMMCSKIISCHIMPVLWLSYCWLRCQNTELFNRWWCPCLPWEAESQLQEILEDGTCIIKTKEDQETVQEARDDSLTFLDPSQHNMINMAIAQHSATMCNYILAEITLICLPFILVVGLRILPQRFATTGHHGVLKPTIRNKLENAMSIIKHLAEIFAWTLFF